MACKYKSKVWDNGWCNVACMYCTLEQKSNCKHNKQTNADRIRAMTDEELIQWFTPRGCPSAYTSQCFEMSCKECWTQWLQQPAEGD